VNAFRISGPNQYRGGAQIKRLSFTQIKQPRQSAGKIRHHVFGTTENHVAPPFALFAHCGVGPAVTFTVT
jgi:hypothetical protein